MFYWLWSVKSCLVWLIFVWVIVRFPVFDYLEAVLFASGILAVVVRLLVGVSIITLGGLGKSFLWGKSGALDLSKVVNQITGMVRGLLVFIVTKETSKCSERLDLFAQPIQ